MPVSREIIEEHVAQLNQDRRDGEQVKLEQYDPPSRFTLSFPNRAMPEGQCIDQDFTEIQFALHEKRGIDTGIQGGRLDPDTDRYVVEYEVVEWD